MVEVRKSAPLKEDQGRRILREGPFAWGLGFLHARRFPALQATHCGALLYPVNPKERRLHPEQQIAAWKNLHCMVSKTPVSAMRDSLHVNSRYVFSINRASFGAMWSRSKIGRHGKPSFCNSITYFWLPTMTSGNPSWTGKTVEQHELILCGLYHTHLARHFPPTCKMVHEEHFCNQEA